jgi:hypothetical protein
MFIRKRKSDDMFYSSFDSQITTLIEEIKTVLIEKNIFMNEIIDSDPQKKNVIINLTDKDNNFIGNINGGVEEFFIMENGEETEQNAFSINWIKVDNKYQGFSLGTFLIIYWIYLCNKNFSDINYVVLDDDTDVIDQSKNIYIKLGFIYKDTSQREDENGNMVTVIGGPEMQLKISDLFNSGLIDRLNKIKITMKNWNTNVGGKGKGKGKKKSKNNRKTKRKSYRKRVKTIKKSKNRK